MGALIVTGQLVVQIIQGDNLKSPVTALVFPIGSVDDGMTPAVVGECTVEFASVSMVGAQKVLTATLSGIDVIIADKIVANGIIYVEAGYKGNSTVPMQKIFYGSVEKLTYNFDGGKEKWYITGTSYPNFVYGIKPNLSQNMEKDTDNPVPITIGAALQRIGESIGVVISFPPVFNGDATGFTVLAQEDGTTFQNAVTLQNWTTTSTAFEEIQKLVNQFNAVAQKMLGTTHRFGVVDGQLNDVGDTVIADPFSLHIEDMDDKKERVLNVDLDGPYVISGGPEVSSEEVPIQTDSDETSDSTRVVVREFALTTIFDPRIGLGLRERLSSAKTGIDYDTRVLAGKHVLNGSNAAWRTERVGKIVSILNLRTGIAS